MWQQRAKHKKQGAETGAEGVWVEINKSKQARRMRMRYDGSEGIIKVTVPSLVSHRRLVSFLESESLWIKEQIAKHPDIIRVQDGALLPLRGTPHLIKATGTFRDLVSLRPAEGSDHLPVISVPGFADHIGRKTMAFIKKLAADDLGQSVSNYCRKLDLPTPSLSLRDSRSRWGSCSSRATLSFSWRLILTPPEVLDYVAAHEVAHLRQLNHSPAFWSLVEFLCPDYRQHEGWLKHHGRSVHCYQFQTRSSAAGSDDKKRFFLDLSQSVVPFRGNETLAESD